MQVYRGKVVGLWLNFHNVHGNRLSFNYTVHVNFTGVYSVHVNFTEPLRNFSVLVGDVPPNVYNLQLDNYTLCSVFHGTVKVKQHIACKFVLNLFNS